MNFWHMRARKTSSLLMAGLLAAGLSGCAVLSVGEGAPPSLYTLTVPDVPQGPRLEAQLGVAEPYTSAAYDTNRMVHKPNPNEIQYFADARWTDRAPRMLQGLLVTGLEKSGRFAAVGRRGSDISPDYEVRFDLRAFGVEDAGDGTKTVHILLSARLTDYRSDRVIASRIFEAKRSAPSAQVAALVREFDQGFAQVTAELADWTAGAIAARQAGG